MRVLQIPIESADDLIASKEENMSMDLTALFLSRLQFAFTISFHIIFPSFTIGLGAWLVVLEAVHLATGRQVYRRLFDFWVKIFAVAFGLGVVSGIVMPFEFGTNWSRLSASSGPIQGPLLLYEAFTAFALEVTSSVAWMAAFALAVSDAPIPMIAFAEATIDSDA